MIASWMEEDVEWVRMMGWVIEEPPYLVKLPILRALYCWKHWVGRSCSDQNLLDQRVFAPKYVIIFRTVLPVIGKPSTVGES